MTEPVRRQAPSSADVPAGNRYDRMEWAGAFGDLGTLIPFAGTAAGVDQALAGRRREESAQQLVFEFTDPLAARRAVPSVVLLGRQNS
jgi:hypothetical protein